MNSLDVEILKRSNPNYGMLDVWYNGENIRFEDHLSYQSRNPAMIDLIRDAWRLGIAGKFSKNETRSFRLYTDDIFNPYCHYSFSANSPDNAWRSMPSFVFDRWPECGIYSYDETFSKLILSGNNPYEDERAFWIGNLGLQVRNYIYRIMGAEVALRRPDLIDFRSVTWDSGIPSNFVDLPGHCRWRVLVDFGAAGFSARVPLLLASGRPVILVGRPEEAWFYWDGSLVPWVHYIPCGLKDGSDLNEENVGNTLENIEKTLEWTFENRGLCEQIGSNGRAYALANLTRDAAVARISRMLEAHPSSISGGPL